MAVLRVPVIEKFVQLRNGLSVANCFKPFMATLFLGALFCSHIIKQIKSNPSKLN